MPCARRAGARRDARGPDGRFRDGERGLRLLRAAAVIRYRPSRVVRCADEPPGSGETQFRREHVVVSPGAQKVPARPSGRPPLCPQSRGAPDAAQDGHPGGPGTAHAAHRPPRSLRPAVQPLLPHRVPHEPAEKDAGRVGSAAGEDRGGGRRGRPAPVRNTPFRFRRAKGMGGPRFRPGGGVCRFAYHP